MLKRVEAVLWRKCNQATYDSLQGISRGQYDIRMARRDFESFFSGVPRSSPTGRGGFDLVVPIEPFTGADPVDATSITIRFMGEESERKDWYIKSQRPETAYPLWRPGRGVPNRFVESNREYVLIVKDIEGKFHARWIDDDHFPQLPSVVREAMEQSEIGWITLT